MHARRYIQELKDQLSKIHRRGPPRPGHNQLVFLPVVPLRDPMIANFSVILARLNHALTKAGEDTNVNSIAKWREKGRGALDIIKATWRPGDCPREPRAPRCSRRCSLAEESTGTRSLPRLCHASQWRNCVRRRFGPLELGFNDKANPLKRTESPLDKCLIKWKSIMVLNLHLEHTRDECPTNKISRYSPTRDKWTSDGVWNPTWTSVSPNLCRISSIKT